MSHSATPTRTEFVAEEFDTSVTEVTTTRFVQMIKDSVRSLRLAIDNDDLTEETLRSEFLLIKPHSNSTRFDLYHLGH